MQHTPWRAAQPTGGTPAATVVLVLAMVAATLGGLPGCATWVTPPAAPAEPATVYVADYGRHSSLLVPRPSGQITEVAYSSWTWSALGWQGPLFVLPVLLIPGQGTLCIKEWPGPADEQTIRQQTEIVHLCPIVVDRSALDRWIADLDDQCRRRAGDGRLESPTGWVYVPSDRSYWIFHTCNAATADWLRELGCRVNGPAIMSNFSVSTQ